LIDIRTASRLLFLGLLTAIAVAGCKTNTTSGKANSALANLETAGNLAAATFDTLYDQLNGRAELMTGELVAMRLIDPTVAARLSESCYCDTTLQLNDSINFERQH
jgi:hypothetical protein